MILQKPAVAGSLESSDALITIEPSSALEVQIESVVMRQFGDAIDRAVREVLAEQDVTSGCIRVQDRGALECTIKARVEAALGRAGEVGK
ncbi:MAG: citrate lyase acyl carrier protein [Clostridia bacterium]